MNEESRERVICIHVGEFLASLTVDKSYRTIADERASEHGMVRVVDDTEEDYLYPESLFEPAQSAGDTEQQKFTIA